MIERKDVGNTHWKMETQWGGSLKQTVTFDIVGPEHMFSLGETALFDGYEWVVKEIDSEPLTYDGLTRQWTVTATRIL